MKNKKDLLWVGFICLMVTNAAQKMKFSAKDLFSKCDQITVPCGFGHITEEILDEKLHFLCSGSHSKETGEEWTPKSTRELPNGFECRAFEDGSLVQSFEVIK